MQAGSLEGFMTSWNLTFSNKNILPFRGAVFQYPDQKLVNKLNKDQILGIEDYSFIMHMESNILLQFYLNHSLKINIVVNFRSIQNDFVVKNQLITGADDAKIKVYDKLNKKIYRTFKGHRGPVYQIKVIINGKQILSSSEDMTIKLWNIEKGTIVNTFRGHTSPIQVLYLHKGTDQYFYSGSTNGELMMWHLMDNIPQKIFRYSDYHHQYHLNHSVLGIDNDDENNVYSIQSSNQLFKFGQDGNVEQNLKFSQNISSMSVYGKGDHIAIGCSDGIILAIKRIRENNTQGEFIVQPIEGGHSKKIKQIKMIDQNHSYISINKRKYQYIHDIFMRNVISWVK